MQNKFVNWSIYVTFAPMKLRGGAVVARWAHNPKVGGSNPPSATKKKPCRESGRGFLFDRPIKSLLMEGIEIKKPAAAAGGCKAFSLLSTPLRIASFARRSLWRRRAKRAILISKASP